MSASFFDFIASVLLLEDPDGLSDEDREVRRQFVLKFQQVTGPVTAKGLEDTAFYRYFPLASLNEVGGEPGTPGTTVEHFHRRIQEQAANWPHTMLATGTHDTKRGEDMRARLNVLSEVSEEWEPRLVRWQAMNAESRIELDGEVVPDANVEVLIYQTLVGTWPLKMPSKKEHGAYVDRVVRYLDKALREAKMHTSWTNPYDEYDRAIAGYVRAILANRELPFAEDLDDFVRLIASAGFTNSLAQLLVKMCVPGVPDFYQGVEFWDFNLVDPDNRRPVDFTARRKRLAKLATKAKKNLPSLATELLENWPDDAIKLFVSWRTLHLRRERAELTGGEYVPLECTGTRQANVIAFARVEGDQFSLCVVPRFTLEAWRDMGIEGKDSLEGTPGWPIAEWWRGTSVRLPADVPADFTHAFSGQTLQGSDSDDGGVALDVADVLASFPVALLTGNSK